jgi:hypothetical protein
MIKFPERSTALQQSRRDAARLFGKMGRQDFSPRLEDEKRVRQPQAQPCSQGAKIAAKELHPVVA